MIGRQTVSQQSDGTAVHGLDHNPLERGIVLRLLKEFISSVSAIEGVVNYFTRRDTCSSRHQVTLHRPHCFSQEKGLRPLFAYFSRVKPTCRRCT